jgi:hypothetical protein
MAVNLLGPPAQAKGAAHTATTVFLVDCHSQQELGSQAHDLVLGEVPQVGGQRCMP